MIDLIGLAERAILPDWLIRRGMRRLLANRLEEERQREAAQPEGALRQFVQELRRSPIAVHTDAANVQHYEAPTEFFQRVLGPRLKYSSCYWPRADTTLPQAEDAMLELFCQRAVIADGMDLLELGCGWGSLCLWIAERFPNCRVLAISNSQTQHEFIESRCRDLGRDNVEVQTVTSSISTACCRRCLTALSARRSARVLRAERSGLSRRNGLVTEPLEVDGVRMIFQNTPNTEAPRTTSSASVIQEAPSRFPVTETRMEPSAKTRSLRALSRRAPRQVTEAYRSHPHHHRRSRHDTRPSATLLGTRQTARRSHTSPRCHGRNGFCRPPPPRTTIHPPVGTSRFFSFAESSLSKSSCDKPLQSRNLTVFIDGENHEECFESVDPKTS